MNEEEKKILEKICEKTGIAYIYVNMYGSDGNIRKYFLRGFLLTPSTVRAVFGEVYSLDPDQKNRFVWQYHLQQMSLLEDNSEILAYYEKFL